MIAAAGGAAYLTYFPRTRTVYVAAVDLPAFHQLTEADVRKVDLSTKAIPAEPVIDRDSVLGRYTLAPVGQDAAMDKTKLGPVLVGGWLASRRLVAVESSTETNLGGALARGDVVDVLLSPTSAEGTAVTIDGVLVVDVRPAPPAVLIAVTQQQESRWMTLRGMSQVTIARVKPYQRP